MSAHDAKGTPDAASPDATTLWRSRGLAALAVRALAVGVPVLLGTVTARLIVLAFGGGEPAWLVAAVALCGAAAVAAISARAGARLLPLAVLLKMTMAFPDQAPSRLKVARRANSQQELRRRLASRDEDARETAVTLLALVTALGRHDRKTRGHSERVRLYCDLLGAELGLGDADRARLRWVGLIHDIGKLEVAAAILNKPSKLDAKEWDAVRRHPDHGSRIAAPLAEWLGPWYEGIRHHHERFDGTGYPLGLAGHEISLAGRAVSVVDAFETMTAARSYKSPMSTAAARAELTRCAGSHFDPAMVRAFLAIALPRLLWSMGPLTFLVNVPFMRWLPTAGLRSIDAAAVGMSTASAAVGSTAMSVAVVAAQAPLVLHQHPVTPATDTAIVQTTDHASRGPSSAPANLDAPTQPPSSSVTAATPTLAPADDSAAPPGQVRTPPGQTRTPPGQLGRTRTPPGQAKTPPGQTRTPPGQTRTPPGQTKTPPGQTRTPPEQADKTDAPTGQASVPPGQAKQAAAPQNTG